MRTPAQRYLGYVTAKTAFTLAAGRVTLASLITAHEHPVYLGSQPGKSCRGVEIQILGTGTDDSTINWKLWRGTLGTRSGGAAPTIADLSLIGSFVSTLSTATLAANDDLLGVTVAGGTTAETNTLMRLADAHVFTTGGVEAALSTAFGSSGPQTPASLGNIPAPVYVPDLGAADFFLIEFDVGTATGADAIIRQFGVQS